MKMKKTIIEISAVAAAIVLGYYSCNWISNREESTEPMQTEDTTLVYDEDSLTSADTSTLDTTKNKTK